MESDIEIDLPDEVIVGLERQAQAAGMTWNDYVLMVLERAVAADIEKLAFTADTAETL